MIKQYILFALWFVILLFGLAITLGSGIPDISAYYLIVLAVCSGVNIVGVVIVLNQKNELSNVDVSVIACIHVILLAILLSVIGLGVITTLNSLQDT